MQKHSLPRRLSCQQDILEKRPTHAFLIPSPPSQEPEKHISTPFPSPKKEGVKNIVNEVVVPLDRINSDLSATLRDLSAKKSSNPYFNF